MAGVHEASLRTAAMDDIARSLSARAQLRLVASLAGELGVDVIVLKGGADVARGLTLRMADVDVLARPGDAARLANALDGAGLVPRKSDGFWHLKPRTAEGALQIEVHRAVTGFDEPAVVPWERTVSLTGYEPLRVFAPHDHARTIIHHAVRKHPARQSRVRDLVILNAAMQACSPEQLRHLTISLTDSGEAYVAMLEMAGRDGVPPSTQKAQLRSEYLLRARMPSVPLLRTSPLLSLLAIDSAAIGTRQNRRRLQLARTDGRRQGLTVRHLLRDPALIAVGASVSLLTLDASRV